jgi:colanic acid/amylovoran biosynthesis glycosyltransferase
MLTTPDQPVAIQVLTSYLPVSQTFIYRHLVNLSRWQPYVFTEHVQHRDMFSLEQIYTLPRPAPWQRASFAALRFLLHDHVFRANFRPSATLERVLPEARVLHAHFGECGIASLPIQRRSGLPLVTSFYGYDAVWPTLKPYSRPYHRRLWRAGAAFIVLSQVMRQQLIALGAPAERVHIVRIGIDPEQIAFQPRRWPADGSIRLLTCGRLVEKKGTRYAIEAVARLRARYPGLSLTIVGDGELRPALEQQVKQAGVADQVHFLGAQPVQRVIAEMAASHIFLLPCVTAANGDQEGTPVVLMEAQAAGMPVVSSLHAGIPEVVRHGVSGFLALERDIDQLVAILTMLLEHPERWPALGAAGRQHMLAEFDTRQAAARLEMVYDSLRYEQT